MRKADVLSHFKKQTRIARVLGLTKSAVSQWGEVIPEGMAYKLEVITRGKLRVDPSLYEQGKPADKSAEIRVS